MGTFFRMLGFLPFWARLVVFAGLALSLVWLLLATVVFAIRWVARRRRPAFYWHRVGRASLVLVPLFLLVGEPLLVGWFATHFLGTREDEIGYRGPRLDASGALIPQDAESLDREAEGKVTVDPEVLAAAAHREVHFTAADGVVLRGFRIPARTTPPRFAVVLAHGLFRGALEIQPVGAMFRELGGDVLLLELRNHGKSGRARPTFGHDEAEDVVAAARYLREQVGPDVPMILFGVSLGSAATALAAPDVEKAVGLDGLILDSTMASLADTAHNFLAERMAMPEPWRSLTLWSVEAFARVRLAAIRPDRAVAELSPRVAALIIGGSADVRTPRAGAEEVFRAIPAPDALPDALKELWIQDGSDHGHVWRDAPEEYAAHLRRFVDRVLATRASR